jgi:conjugal transfer pilus assembly protein TraV
MKTILTLTLTLILQGCASSFACKGFPQFSACKSASQAYRATNNGPPPEYATEGATEPSEHGSPWTTGTHSGGGPSIDRTQAQTLRIWQAPYEDDHGDLIGSSTILTEVEPRRWRMGQTQMPVPRRLAPLQMASGQRTSTADSTGDRGGFPLFPTPQGPRRLHVEEVDYREP